MAHSSPLSSFQWFEQARTPGDPTASMYVHMCTYVYIIERCLIVCFAFCFSAHSRPMARQDLPFLNHCLCSTVDRCLLSNYHKQIRPKPSPGPRLRQTLTVSTLRASDFKLSAKVAGDATRWEALLLCRHFSYYILYIYSKFKCYWRVVFFCFYLAGILQHHSQSLGAKESAYSIYLHNCVFIFLDNIFVCLPSLLIEPALGRSCWMIRIVRVNGMCNNKIVRRFECDQQLA